MTVFGPLQVSRFYAAVFSHSTTSMVSSRTIDLSGQTYATRICSATAPNTFIALPTPRSGPMFQISGSYIFCDVFRNMVAKTSSTISKLWPPIAKPHARVKMFATKLSTCMHPSRRRSSGYKWKLTNQLGNSSLDRSPGLPLFKSTATASTIGIVFYVSKQVF